MGPRQTGIVDVWVNDRKDAADVWVSDRRGAADVWVNDKKGAADVWVNDIKTGATDQCWLGQPDSIQTRRPRRTRPNDKTKQA